MVKWIRRVTVAAAPLQHSVAERVADLQRSDPLAFMSVTELGIGGRVSETETYVESLEWAMRAYRLGVNAGGVDS